MRRIIGLDLNGWHDQAARDWHPGEDHRLDNPVLIDGGLDPVAIQRLGTQGSGPQSGQWRQTQWVGGPQAVLAPHGRGVGWGDIGQAGLRIKPDIGTATTEPAVRAAVDALTKECEELILTVPDLADFDEAAQDRLLTLLRQPRRQARLLWRSVALFLDALHTSAIAADAVDARFRIVIHSRRGFEVQTLRLRADSDHAGHVAPEREGYGACVLPEQSLDNLVARVDTALIATNPWLAERRCDPSRLAVRLLAGDAGAGEIEILRHQNGTWLEAIAPKLDAAAVIGAPTAWAPPLGDVAATFLATPLSPEFAQALCSAIAPRFGAVILLPWSGIARGALKAGRLIDAGLPHYFDRLVPIALAVSRDGEPAFEDLISQNKTLPANREYVSAPFEGLVWGKAKTDIDFYVRKGAHEMRLWRARQDKGPPRDAKVTLRLRQTPGQSWAKLSVTSREWDVLERGPIFLDWARLTPLDLSPDEVLEQLRTPLPTIPARIVEGADIAFWVGGRWVREGLNELLDNATRLGTINPADVLQILRRQMRDPTTRLRIRAVGTDGALPANLPSHYRDAFLALLNSCAVTIINASNARPLRNTTPILCATWAFVLCPEPAQDAIVTALEADSARASHPLLAAPNAPRVLINGAGRAVDGTDRLRRLLIVLADRSPNNDTVAALAMILARRKTAPAALSGALVERLFKTLAAELTEQLRTRSFKTKFNNTLLALAALFRWREKEPRALLAAHDPNAAKIRDILTMARNEIDRIIRQVPQGEEKRQIIDEIIAYLDGAGDPNILKTIDFNEDADDD